MIRVPPPGRIAIGTATVGGQKVEVFLTTEWARYFDSLTTQSDSTAAAVGAPGSLGTTGATGVGVSFNDDSGAGVEFIPGPPGPSGPQGDPGPVIFLMQEPQDNDVFWPVNNT